MTENEATRELKSIKSFMKNHGRTTGCDFLESEYEALNMAIQALEEIQQYRAIGTVEELEVLNRIAEETAEYVKKDKKILETYQRIGTIEEFRALKEKSVAKKPIRDKEFSSLFECPTCGRRQKIIYELYHCKECGQKLDWSE